MRRRMRPRPAGRIVGVKNSSVLASALAACTLILAPSAPATGTHVGSDTCKKCHFDIWSSFRASGHPFALRSDVDRRPLPLPGGHDVEDVGWIVGGRTHKANYLDTDGYLITTAYPGQPNETPGRNEYDLVSGEWLDLHAGETKPSDCGRCHSTGYVAGAPNPNPGLVGTWELEGVQCEACHGPASGHVGFPFSNPLVDPSAKACGKCHSNGDLSQVLAADGFLRPNSQYNELLAGPHRTRFCTECHDPHARGDLSFRIECTDCHTHAAMASPKAFQGLGRRHLDHGVRCIDCHMPYVVKSSASHGPWKADLRSHLFEITLNPDAKMFKAGGTLAKGKLTAGYACLGCHVEVADKWTKKGKPKKAEAWARKHAAKIHDD